MTSEKQTYSSSDGDSEATAMRASRPSAVEPSVSVRRRLRQCRVWLRHRRWRNRCDECGGVFLPSQSVHSFGSRDGKKWHDKCIGYVQFRRERDEQLVVLDLITEVWGITMSDVTTLMEGRAEREGYETSNAYNLGWRVMYAVEKRREAASASAGSDGAS